MTTLDEILKLKKRVDRLEYLVGFLCGSFIGGIILFLIIEIIGL